LIIISVTITIILTKKARNATEKIFSNVGNISKIMDVHSATRLYCLRSTQKQCPKSKAKKWLGTEPYHHQPASCFNQTDSTSKLVQSSTSKLVQSSTSKLVQSSTSKTGWLNHQPASWSNHQPASWSGSKLDYFT